MPVEEFKLPDVGEGVAEGELVQWLVEPGDTVSEDQPVAEVETDKALVEVPSPYDGTVKELFAEEGEMVPVGTVIISFEVGDGEAVAEEATAETAEEVTTEAAEPEAEAGQPEDKRVETPEGRVFAAPRVRTLARELGVDIASVEGSGPSGRIAESDVREAAERRKEPAAEAATTEAEPEPAEPEATEGAAAAGAAPVDTAARERTLAAPATRRLAQEEGVDLNAVPASETRDGEAFVTPEDVREYAAAQRAAQEADAAAAEAPETAAGGEPAAGLSGERVPYRGVRRTIGEAMERSKYTAPHVTHHDVVEVTNLVEFREEVKELAAERDVKLTYMPFVMKAVVAALKEFPFMNAMLDDDSEEIILRDDYHIGVATATDAGLMVPVVENVDEKSILQVAREMNEKVQKARDRSIAREELQGSTFSVTNVGAIGGEYATPILNYPETGILALGAIRDRPWVVERETDDGDTEKAVVPRKTVTLSLTIDHRIVDGAVAAEFTNKVKEFLAHPKLLLLE